MFEKIAYRKIYAVKYVYDRAQITLSTLRFFIILFMLYYLLLNCETKQKSKIS